MKNWMNALSHHYQALRLRHPDERLLLVFGIDDVILDMRRMVLDLLRGYDSNFSTRYFTELSSDDINVHETRINCLFERLKIEPSDQDLICSWYYSECKNPRFLASHLPYPGVMSIIRWFQLQKNTSVALNSERSEEHRRETLLRLNRLGEAYKVCFDDQSLFMNRSGKNADIIGSKIEGIRYFKGLGYRIAAVVDNEPAILKAYFEQEDFKDILLLHANTVFTSNRTLIPISAVAGRRFSLSDLTNRTPCQIQHGSSREA
ncbi:MAG: hypothetical protein ACU833_00305 [Gammaproteobacteria bacterium]